MDYKTGAMRCGNCGKDQYRLRQEGRSRLVVTCVNCDSSSVIQPTLATLQIKWGDGEKDTGIPAVF